MQSRTLPPPPSPPRPPPGDLLHQNLHVNKSSRCFTGQRSALPRGMPFPATSLLIGALHAPERIKGTHPCLVTVEGKKHALPAVVKGPFTVTHWKIRQP